MKNQNGKNSQNSQNSQNSKNNKMENNKAENSKNCKYDGKLPNNAQKRTAFRRSFLRKRLRFPAPAPHRGCPTG